MCIWTVHVAQEGERGVVIHARISGSVNHQLALSTFPTNISRNVEYKKEERIQKKEVAWPLRWLQVAFQM
jgi:hypothetical protein